MYSRSAKGGEKGDPNRNPCLAKMLTALQRTSTPFTTFTYFLLKFQALHTYTRGI